MQFRLFPSFAIMAYLCAILCSGSADDSPGFFLKITKNVPRLGKRAEMDSYFMKNTKTIPRIGRSDLQHTTELSQMLSWLWNEKDDAAMVSKRRIGMPYPPVERELSVVQPVNSNTLLELLNRDAIPSEQVKFVHWKDFDRALLSDADLYAKVISLGRKPDQHLKQDLSFSSYIPLFGNSNDGGTDFMLYNKDDRLAGSHYDPNFLHYNQLK